MKVKMIFKVNDLATLKRMYEDAPKHIFDDVKPFKCTYILYGEKSQFPERYELYDENGDKMNINDLNGYQRGIVLGDCDRYFEGKKPQYDNEYMFEEVEEVML